MNPLNLGFSQLSLDDAYNLYVTVEAFFGRPVKLHAPFNTGHPTQMLFPVTGRHSDLNVALLGEQGQYLSAPPRLKTIQPIKDALRKQGYMQ
jgi:CelD/BcsL family acetyltransferase involved in cellulose biosynthesis